MVPLQVDPVGAVQTITGWYTEDDGLFRFEGGRLLKNIFPVWSADFERALMELVDTNEKRNVESVLEVLLNYEGEPFLHGICKHMVSCQAEEEKVLNTIENVLMNTGVVSGEFGFPEAYERKAEEISNWLDDSDEHVREFASGYIKNLNKDNMFILGKSKSEAIAHEGALKIKELSYIHAESYSASKLKHGPFAMLEPDFPVILIAPHNKYYNNVMNAYEEIRSREAYVLMITDNENTIAENKITKLSLGMFNSFLIFTTLSICFFLSFL